jgi:5-methylcytosine-specific restriction endonuclease McrA
MFGKKRTSQFEEKNYNWKNGCGIYRRRAYKKYGYKCNRCGFDNKKILLVHHKDRNRKNNNVDNLEVLCKNCHSLEHYNEIHKKFLEYIKTKNKKNSI